MCGVHTSVELEKRGIPTTFCITSAFRNALDVQYKGKGMPGHPCIELPHPRRLAMRVDQRFGEYPQRIYRLLGME